jgi:N-acetylmuramoyl-L-alanine amidase
MKRYADKANGVHFYDNLVVLKTAQQAALLIEAGVIVNRDEELRVSEPAWRAAFAQAVAGGVAACMAGRGRVGGTLTAPPNPGKIRPVSR